MLKYINGIADKLLTSQEVSNHFNDLLMGLLVDFENFINCERSKHTMHAISKHCRYSNPTIILDHVSE